LKKSSLLQTYTPNHPTVIAVMDEIKQLSKNREQFTVQLKNAPEYEQDVSTLTREVTIKNDLYTLLLNQIHQLLVIKNGIASDIQILSPASAPTVIQPVKLSVLIILSFVAGLILCALGILISKIFLKTPPINENNKVTALFQYSASN